MNKIVVLIAFVFFSCASKWENKPINKFLGESIIDTTKYNTYDNLILNNQIEVITTTDSFSNITHFDIPIVSENKYLFIERKYYPDNKKNVIIKIDTIGKIIDSIIINKDCAIINDLIIDKDYYCTWFINNDKNLKPLENINLYSKSDTSKITALVKTLRKDKVPFYSTSEYSEKYRIDTCNYIITFKQNKLAKYNYLKSIRPNYELHIKSETFKQFTKKFSDVKSFPSEKLFKVDNFYAYSFDKQIREGTSGSDFFSNTGTSFSYCNSYNGTYYITLQTQSNLKLKIMNKQLCEKSSTDKIAEKYDVYTEDFLNFYIIDVHGYYYDIPLYYVLKK